MGSTPCTPCTGSCGGYARICSISRIPCTGSFRACGGICSTPGTPCTSSFAGYARICQKAFLHAVLLQAGSPLAVVPAARTSTWSSQLGLNKRQAAARCGRTSCALQASTSVCKERVLSPNSGFKPPILNLSPDASLAVTAVGGK